MRKQFKKIFENPLYLSLGVLVIFLLLWFFPNLLNLVTNDYTLSQYRSDLKDLINVFYIVITLWLVLVTRKMAEVSLNSQKAFNRPEIYCELFISSEKPSLTNVSNMKNIEIRNTIHSQYSEGQSGASIFLIIKNRYGGGKAIKLEVKTEFAAMNPEGIAFNRNTEIEYLAEGDCVAVYCYRFDRPSTENCSLELKYCTLKFTTPFNEASNDPSLEIKHNYNNPILATGNHIGAIKLDSGIRVND